MGGRVLGCPHTLSCPNLLFWGPRLYSRALWSVDFTNQHIFVKQNWATEHKLPVPYVANWECLQNNSRRRPKALSYLAGDFTGKFPTRGEFPLCTAAKRTFQSPRPSSSNCRQLSQKSRETAHLRECHPCPFASAIHPDKAWAVRQNLPLPVHQRVWQMRVSPSWLPYKRVPFCPDFRWQHGSSETLPKAGSGCACPTITSITEEFQEKTKTWETKKLSIFCPSSTTITDNREIDIICILKSRTQKLSNGDQRD